MNWMPRLFIILGSFDFLSHHPTNTSCHWHREDFQWIIDKVCREKRIIVMASTLPSRISLLNF